MGQTNQPWGFDDRAAFRKASKEKRDEGRGDILPFKKTDEGIEWALPQWMIDTWDAIKLPSEVLAGNIQPTAEDIANFALTVGAGGVGGGASGMVPEGAIGTFSGRKPTFTSPMYKEGQPELPPQRRNFPTEADKAHEQALIDEQYQYRDVPDDIFTDTIIPDDEFWNYNLAPGNEDFNLGWEMIEGEEIPGLAYGWDDIDDSINESVIRPDMNWGSPIIEALDAMDFPAKGSSILKDLREKAPSIRKAELDTFNLQLDPNAVYTRGDLTDIIDKNKWEVSASFGKPEQYRGYQRQNVVDEEIDYVEIPITAKRAKGADQPGFKANSQHFSDNTLGHVRLSLRGKKDPEWQKDYDELGRITDEAENFYINHNRNGYFSPDDAVEYDRLINNHDKATKSFYQKWGDGSGNFPHGPKTNYVLVEELQSDLLQKGWTKPEKGPPPNFSEELSKIDDFIKNSSIPDEIKDETKNWAIYEFLKPLHYHSREVRDNTLSTLNNEYKRIQEWKKSKSNTEYHDLLESIYNIDSRLHRKLIDLDLEGQNFIERFLSGSVSDPPISSTTDSVRLGLQAAIGYAQKNGVDKIIIPNVSRIVDVRRSTGVDASAATDPKSSFIATYVNAANKVLKQLINESGGKIKVGPTELEYNPVKDGDQFDTVDEAISQILQEIEGNDFVRSLYENPYGLIDMDRVETEAKNRLKSKKLPSDAVEIDISGLRKERDLTRPRFAKGGEIVKQGVQMNKDVPPGAKPSEVADDVPIMASEGEYIIPANVVRYIGLEKIQKMVDSAKEALGDDSVQTPGGETDDDELPFDPSELQAMPHMAEGGQVGGFFPSTGNQGFTVKPFTDKNGNVIYIPFMGDRPLYQLPEGYTEASEQKPTEEKKQTTINPLTGKAIPLDNSAKENTAFVKENESPLAGNPNDWGVEDFINFGKQKGDTGTMAIKGMIGMMPGGRLGMMARDKWLNGETSDLLDQMIETGVDLQGNVIPEEQKTQLNQVRQELINQMGSKSGLNLSPVQKLGDAFRSFQRFTTGTGGQADPMKSVSPDAEKMLNSFSSPGQGVNTNNSDNQYSGDRSLGSDLGRDPSKGPSEGSIASGGLYNKGGLITRRGSRKDKMY